MTASAYPGRLAHRSIGERRKNGHCPSTPRTHVHISTWGDRDAVRVTLSRQSLHHAPCGEIDYCERVTEVLCDVERSAIRRKPESRWISRPALVLLLDRENDAVRESCNPGAPVKAIDYVLIPA